MDFQLEVERMVRASVINSMGAPEIPEEYGFHYAHSIDVIRNAVDVLELFNKWPDAGGYFDQDANLIDDMMTYKRLYNYIKTQYKQDTTDAQ